MKILQTLNLIQTIAWVERHLLKKEGVQVLKDKSGDLIFKYNHKTFVVISFAGDEIHLNIKHTSIRDTLDERSKYGLNAPYRKPAKTWSSIDCHRNKKDITEVLNLAYNGVKKQTKLAC